MQSGGTTTQRTFERRIGSRVPVESVPVRWKVSSTSRMPWRRGSLREVPGRLVEVSLTGVGIVAPLELGLQRGDRVYVRAQGRDNVVSVRHVRTTDDGSECFVGAELTKWAAGLRSLVQSLLDDAAPVRPATLGWFGPELGVPTGPPRTPAPTEAAPEPAEPAVARHEPVAAPPVPPPVLAPPPAAPPVDLPPPAPTPPNGAPVPTATTPVADVPAPSTPVPVDVPAPAPPTPVAAAARTPLDELLDDLAPPTNDHLVTGSLASPPPSAPPPAPTSAETARPSPLDDEWLLEAIGVSRPPRSPDELPVRAAPPAAPVTAAVPEVDGPDDAEGPPEELPASERYTRLSRPSAGQQILDDVFGLMSD